MNKVAIILLLLLIVVQCKNTEVNQPTTQLSYVVESEELKPYLLSETDTAYSASIKFLANDSIVLKYWVQLLDDSSIHIDSLYFTIPKGQKVAGEIIFPNCTYHSAKKPSFKSKIEVIEKYN